MPFYPKKMRRMAAMISTLNDYSLLKWPLIMTSVLITLLALLLLLSFCSSTWFTFEITAARNVSTIANSSAHKPPPLAYGSFGMWQQCSADVSHPVVHCHTYTRESRPEDFSVILILFSCAMFITNLTVFPSWAATLLVLYNSNNRYIAYMVMFVWILFIMTMLTAVLLLGVMLFVGTSTFYSPGKLVSGKLLTVFHVGWGVSLLLFSTILALFCLFLVIVTLIWKKFIEVKLQEEEKELFRQLTEDNFKPGWHKLIRIPHIPPTSDDASSSPPPYRDESRSE